MRERLFSILTRSKCKGQITFTLAFLFIFQISFSQINQTARYEFRIPTHHKYINLIPNGNQGLFLFQDLETPTTEGNYWKMTLLDTSLNEVWNHLMIIDRNYRVLQTDTLAGSAYLLLANRRDYRDSQIIKISSEGKLESTPFRNLVPMSVTKFMVIDGGKRLLMGGYFNYRPVVILYDFLNNRPQILPGMINEPGILMQLTRDEKSGTIDALFKIQDRYLGGTWLKTYNYRGEMIKNIRFDFNKRSSLTNGRVVRLDDDFHLLVGPYGTRNSDYSHGMFFGIVGEEDVVQSTFINYAELPNFFDFAKPRRQERIQRRIQRKEEKGKTPRFNFRVAVQDLMRKGDDFVVLGEAHYIKYKNSYQSIAYSDPRLRGMIFDGFVYTHAFLVGLGIDGDVRWDQSIGTNGVKKFELEQLVNFSMEKDKGVLMYPMRDKIRFTSFDTSKDSINMQSEVDIRLLNPADQIRSNESLSANIKFWYGNNYYLFGRQVIKNARNNAEPLNRRVYFVNKIQYSESNLTN